MRRTDPLELVTYRDTGCRYWRRCLSCPFPLCVYEVPGGPTRIALTYRNGAMRELHRRGVPTVEIARQFGVGRRTVERAVQRRKVR